MRSKLREIVKRIVWEENPRSYEMIIIDRLVPGGVRVVMGDEVKGIDRFDHVLLRDGSIIPLHRVIVVRKNGIILIDRRTHHVK